MENFWAIITRSLTVSYKPKVLRYNAVMVDPSPSEQHDATYLLQRVSEGGHAAVGDLLPMVYAELRSRAGAYFRGQPSNHTLQPTALVHEAYLKLVRNPSTGWNNRAHFCAVAAAAMRQVLVNHV